MPERNICKELGCPALCCRNIGIETREGDFLNCFPESAEITRVEYANLAKFPNGVYYLYDYENDLPNWVIGIIKGPCPKLTQEGDCSNYENRTQAAKNTEIGGSLCTKVRTKAGFPPIAKEDLQKITTTCEL